MLVVVDKQRVLLVMADDFFNRGEGEGTHTELAFFRVNVEMLTAVCVCVLCVCVCVACVCGVHACVCGVHVCVCMCVCIWRQDMF